MLTPEENLLTLACLEPLTADEGSRLASIAASPTLDWSLVQRLAALNKVEPRLVHVLAARGLWGASPRPVAQALEAAAATVEAANARRVERAVHVLAALRAADVDVCLLKGVLFAETLYGDPAYKRMNDVDLLVHLEDVPRVAEVYQRLGWFPIAERVAGKPKLNQKVSHHLPPYTNRALDCLLGTQWGLKSPLVGLHIDYAALWRRSETFDYRGVPLRKLSSRDNLFHVCVHLGVFKSGLRDLMDIANLVRQESGRIDWPAFVDDVRRARAQALVVHALTLVHCLDPRDETGWVLAALHAEARGFYVDAARRKARSPAVLLRSCTGHLSTVEKNVSAYNVARYFPEKARLFVQFWQSVLAPPPSECARLSFDPQPTALSAALARVRAPRQILRAISAEIGGGLLGLLVAKSVVDLATSLARWPLAERSQSDLAAWARSLGLTLDDLRRVQDGIH